MNIRFNASQHSLQNLDFESLFDYGSQSSVSRGRDYYEKGHATVEFADDIHAIVHVRGSRWYPYTVEIRLGSRQLNTTIRAECDCQYAKDEPWILCKHKVCALLALQDYYSNYTPPGWSSTLSGVISKQKPSQKREDKHLLLFQIEQMFTGHVISPYRLPLDHLQMDELTDANAVAEKIAANNMLSHAESVNYSKMLERAFSPTPLGLTATRLILESHRYYNVDISPDALLPLLAGSIVFYNTWNRETCRRIQIRQDPAGVELSINRENGGLRLSPLARFEDTCVELNSSDVTVLFEKPMWVLVGSTAFPVRENLDMAKMLLENNGLVIPADDEQEFFEKYLPALIEQVPVTGDINTHMREVFATPVPRVYLSESEGELTAELRFGYDSFETTFQKSPPAQSVKWNSESAELIRVNRDTEAEEQAWRGLSSHGLKRAPNSEALTLRQGVDAVAFLIHHIPHISAAGYEVYGEEDIKSVRVNRSQPRVSLWVSSGIDWFDVRAVVNFGDVEAPLADIRRAIKKQEKYIKLCDGSIGEIPEEWIKRYRRLFSAAEESGEDLRLSKSQVMLLDAALEEADSSQADEEFERNRARLKDFTRIEPCELPGGFTGELRHYQKAGYDWLHFLHEYGFGGCLADDMGIGKTVQALVFMQSLRESGHTNSANLVVMPRSLLANWKREAARFTPSLRVLIHADQGRAEDVETFDDYDLVLTTYGVMLRDVDVLSTYRFHYVVLDESQAVKNPLSQTARASRLLTSDHKLVLTGTPVENSTTELWSQFAFLNPGMLGSLDHFKSEFASPIEKYGDAEAAERLRALVRPFILRRTKEQVTPELPPRTERVVYCEMSAAQQKLYNRTRDSYRAQLLGVIEESGINRAQMKVLEGLLRLRQISNSPKLVDKTSKADSGKLEILMETLETLAAEGHKALVFSQFTQMLKLVKTELDARRIPYTYLDGHTKDRQERVDTFQANPDIPFFLISLKAGGVGLNLTAADYVVHIDPWWNPAVEQQASDRTHRIGQDKPVFVHKLIAQGSVEEKMLELQERKRELVNKLVTTESGFLKSLTADDVRELFS